MNTQLTIFKSIHILFPFTDLLNDGYSSFIYDRYILLTATNLVASAGTLPYGEVPIPAYFDPPNEAYEFAPSPGAAGTILLDAYTVTGILGNLLNPNPVVTTRCIPLPNVGPWPLNLCVSPLPLLFPLSLNRHPLIPIPTLHSNTPPQLHQHNQPTHHLQRPNLRSTNTPMEHHALSRCQSTSWHQRRYYH
jgi:hypothetical protein